MADTVDISDKTADPAEAFIARLEDEIRAALARSYTSYSSKNRIPTGNAYQAVRLRGATAAGFRATRPTVLAGLDLRDRKVLDVGSNLGEMSRLARASGAALVDGFEYDPYFVRIAQAVNVVNDVTRVSFFRRDATDPAIYAEPYDVVLCFSVFTYVRKVLAQIERICRRVLVVETHKVTEDWWSTYVDAVQPHFPHYCIAERTDWGGGKDGARLLMIYAKDAAEIRDYIARRGLALANAPEGLRHLDAQRGEAPFLAAVRKWLPDPRPGGLDGLEPMVRSALAALPDFAASPDYRSGASGLVYWLAYLDGYFQFRRDGQIAPDNTYVRYLQLATRDLRLDPYMRKLVEGDQAKFFGRLQRRFEDTGRAARDETLSPITIFNPMPADAELPFHLVDAESGASIGYSHQDGYHRHFSSYVAGARRLGYRPLWHPQAEQFTSLLATAPGLNDRLRTSLFTGLF